MMDVDEQVQPVIRNSSGYTNIQTEDEVSDTPSSTKVFKTYYRRFYILGLFALYTMMQATAWNSWGPVAHSASVVFGWDNTTLALLPAWGPILFIFVFIFMVKALLRFGLRCAILHCSFLLALGTIIRCIPGSTLFRTLTAHGSAILISYCGPLAMMGPTVLSVSWFPPHQRTTSTAIMTLSNNNIAFGVSFLFPKLFVKDRNVTDITNATEKANIISAMQQEIDFFLLSEAVICSVIFLLVLLYFPKKPPTPPSSSAALERVEFREGARTLVRLPNFWILMITSNVPLGVFPGFMSVLPQALEHYGVTQDMSDWIGLYSSLAGIVGGIAFSRLADCFRNKTKLLLILCMLGCVACFGVFFFISFDIIPFRTDLLYIVLTAGGFFAYGSIPMFYELACELSYPVGEEVVTGLLTGATNVGILFFYVMMMIKQLGTQWVSPVLAASCILSVPCLMAIRERYYRLDVDLDGGGDSDQDVLVENG